MEKILNIFLFFFNILVIWFIFILSILLVLFYFKFWGGGDWLFPDFFIALMAIAILSTFFSVILVGIIKTYRESIANEFLVFDPDKLLYLCISGIIFLIISLFIGSLLGWCNISKILYPMLELKDCMPV